MTTARYLPTVADVATVRRAYGAHSAAIVRRTLFAAQDAIAREVARENAQHPALFRARRRCVWDA